MEDQDLRNLRQSVEKLAFRNRRLARALAMSVSILTLAVIALAAVGLRLKSTNPPNRILRVRGLVVVDANGVERVRIQAALPDPVILGQRFPRGGAVNPVAGRRFLARW